MKKLIAIILVLLPTLIGCNNHDTATNREESAFVISAKDALINKLEKKFKKGTKAENQTVIYEKDSICVIDFDVIYTFASGNTASGKCEFVYYPEGELQGFFIDIEKEPTAIDQCKQWMDEAELELSASEKENMGSFDGWMKFWVKLRNTKEYLNSEEFNAKVQEEYENTINSK